MWAGMLSPILSSMLKIFIKTSTSIRGQKKGARLLRPVKAPTQVQIPTLALFFSQFFGD